MNAPPDIARPLVPTSTAEYDRQFDELRNVNIAVALQAGHIALLLGERLGIEAMRTSDTETVRKIYDSVARKAEVPEKQAAADKTATAAAAILTIILDDSIPQVAPPKKKRVLTNVSDAVEIQAVPPTADPAPIDAELSWGDF